MAIIEQNLFWRKQVDFQTREILQNLRLQVCLSPRMRELNSSDCPLQAVNESTGIYPEDPGFQISEIRVGCGCGFCCGDLVRFRQPGKSPLDTGDVLQRCMD